MRHREWALLKWSCLGISVGSMVVAAVLLWVDSRTAVSDQPQQTAVKDEQQPRANVEKPLIVERRGERMIWRLQADSAQQQGQGLYLTEPGLEMFTEAGEVIPIRGREAWFEPIRKNIRFQGAVEVSYREWRLHSDTLRYDSKRDKVVIPGEFRLERPGITLHGRGLRADRNAERLMVEHDVRVEDASAQTLAGGGAIQVESESLLVGYKKKRATFRGAVHLKRDGFALHSDRLVAFYRQKMGGEIERAEAYGNVVMQQGDKRGSSEKAIYKQAEGILILIGDAKMEDPGGMIRGERIIHHINTAVTTVQQGSDGERARLFMEDEELEKISGKNEAPSTGSTAP